MSGMAAAIRIITVSGLPGSGTTTVCRLLAAELGWTHVNAGRIFRQLAVEAGVSLAAYGSRAEGDGRIDCELDERMVATAREGNPVILEGRLTGWMAQRHGLPPPAVFAWLEDCVLGAFGSPRSDLGEVLGLVSSGRLDLSGSISARLPLTDVNRALEMLESGEGDPVRIVLLPWEEA